MSYQKDAKLIEVHGVKYPRVTHILQEVGEVETRWYNEQAADRGTTIHMLTTLLDSGVFGEEELVTEYSGYLGAYLKFLEDAKPEILETEKEVTYYNKMDGTCYIGHFDRLAVIDRRKYLIDIKTGGLEKWHGLQLAAYRLALGEDVHNAVLQLRNDGTYRFVKAYKGVSFDDESWVVNWRIALRKYFKEHRDEQDSVSGS